VALEAETDLYNTPTEKDEADRTDQAEDKIGQVVDDRDRVTGCKVTLMPITRARDRTAAA